MDQNPQNNTNNNQDLDSLLKEFQSLSASSEVQPEVNKTVSEQPQMVVSQSQVSNVNEQALASNVTPTGQQASQQTVNMSQMSSQMNVGELNNVAVNNNQSSSTLGQTPMTPQSVVAPQSTPVSELKPSNPEIDMSVLNEEVPVHPDMNVTLDSDGGDKNPVDLTNNNTSDNGQDNNFGNNKGNLIFMAVIFIIIGAFILFIPKIDSFFKKKPGMEAKPTPTPTAQATNKPVVESEKTVVCTMPVQAATNLETQKKYKYYYKDGKVTKLEVTTDKKYLALDETTQAAYTNDQNVCSTLATTYANILGYAASCEENNQTFSVKNSYDLVNFVNPTTITINGVQQTLTSDVNLNDDIETVKENMTNQGATCK